MNRGKILPVVVLFFAFLLTQDSMFRVEQTELALVVQLGKPVGEIHEPGLHFKIPFIQSVIKFENGGYPLDSSNPNM